jgi:hypothetical protein
VLVGVVYRSEGRVYGAVNVRAVEARSNFAAEQAVSPKVLSGAEKIARWRNIWFSNVTIAIVNP